MASVLDALSQDLAELADRKAEVEKMAGWVPSLDGPQLLQAAAAINMTITNLQTYSVKLQLAAEEILRALPPE